MTNGINVPTTNSSKLLIMCDHAFSEIKIGFPVHTLAMAPLGTNDSGRVVLCDLCFEKSKGGNWEQIPAGSICEHCFVEQEKIMKGQRKVN